MITIIEKRLSPFWLAPSLVFSKHILFFNSISYFVLHLVCNSFVFAIVCILNSTQFPTGLCFAFCIPPGLRQVNLRLDVLLLALLKKCRALKKIGLSGTFCNAYAYVVPGRLKNSILKVSFHLKKEETLPQRNYKVSQATPSLANLWLVLAGG